MFFGPPQPGFFFSFLIFVVSFVEVSLDNLTYPRSLYNMYGCWEQLPGQPHMLFYGLFFA
jgi:hypothetical protein